MANVNSVKIRSEEVDEQMFTLAYWREEFERLRQSYPKVKCSNLAVFDNYFLLIVGNDAFVRAKLGKASFESTRRVVVAFQKHVDSLVDGQKVTELRRSRQKLVSA